MNVVGVHPRTNPCYARDDERLWCPVICPTAEAVLPHVLLAAVRRILDVGAGCGALAPALRDAAPNAEVVGVDRSLDMLRLAKERGVSVEVLSGFGFLRVPTDAR